MQGIAKDLIVGAAGLVTSVLTALLLWWVEGQFGFSVYGWTFWLLVPIGAILSGAVAASGYFLAARFFGIRPSWRLLVSMIVISVGCYFLIHYLSYSSFEVDVQGKGTVKLRDHMGFGEYLDATIKNTTFGRIGRDNTGAKPLGSLGWVLAGLQILGFSVGGVGVYLFLTRMPYCEDCSKYLRKTSSLDRFTEDAEAVDAKIQSLGDVDVAEWGAQFEGFGEAKFKKGLNFKTSVVQRACPECSRRQTEIGVEVWGGSQWNQQMCFADWWNENATTDA